MRRLVMMLVFLAPLVAPAFGSDADVIFLKCRYDHKLIWPADAEHKDPLETTNVRISRYKIDPLSRSAAELISDDNGSRYRSGPYTYRAELDGDLIIRLFTEDMRIGIDRQTGKLLGKGTVAFKAGRLELNGSCEKDQPWQIERKF
jgi:hypothetical protein